MASPDYPIDLRVDYPAQSSRGWAALTILLIKLFALIPHAVVLLFLSIAQLVAAFIAQVAVALTGEYPPRLFGFVTGVLRWSTRVSAFLYSLTDRYPPFTLQPDDSFGVDVVVERPARLSRLYAAFTALVQVLAIVAAVGFVIWLIRDAGDWFANLGGTDDTNPTARFNPQSWTWGGLLLRQIAALPHYIILIALGIASLVIWLVVQWVILFTGVYPRGMFDLVAGIARWQTRVSGYVFGLSDRYPPFTFEPSLTAGAGPAAVPGAPWSPGGPWPPDSGQPTNATWPQNAVQPVAAPWPQNAVQPVAAPPQWYADPLGRHQYRYWDGTQWTPHVADEGVAGYDPVDGPA